MAARYLLLAAYCGLGHTSQKDLYVHAGESVLLPCQTSGGASPDSWLIWEHLGLGSKREQRLFDVKEQYTWSSPVVPADRMFLFKNRSLLLTLIEAHDAGRYNCWTNGTYTGYDLTILTGRKESRGCLMLTCTLWSLTVYLDKDEIEWSNSHGALRSHQHSSYTIYHHRQASQLQICQQDLDVAPGLVRCILKQPVMIEHEFVVTEADVAAVCDTGTVGATRNWDSLKIIFGACTVVELWVIVILTATLLRRRRHRMRVLENLHPYAMDDIKGAPSVATSLKGQQTSVGSDLFNARRYVQVPPPCEAEPAAVSSTKGWQKEPGSDLKPDRTFVLYENMLPQRLKLRLQQTASAKGTSDRDSHIYCEA